MVTAAEQTIHEDFLVIAHPSGGRVVLVQGRGWSLPRLTNAIGMLWRKTPEWQSTGRVERAMWARLRLPGPVLRCLHVGNGQGLEFVYEVTPPPATWTPPDGSHWVDRDELRRMRLDVPEHYDVLDQWFAEANDPAALARRPAWYRPGWEDDAFPWIKEQLTRLDLAVLDPPEKLRHRERSCELRIPTSGGRVRFKAVPHIFAHEAPVIDMLSRVFPHEVPKVLAYDDTRHWMLLDDGARGPTLDQGRDVARWADALRRYAEMQIASRPHVAALEARGCPVRPVQDLPAKLDALLSDTATLNDEQPAPDNNGRLMPPSHRRRGHSPPCPGPGDH